MAFVRVAANEMFPPGTVLELFNPGVDRLAHDRPGAPAGTPIATATVPAGDVRVPGAHIPGQAVFEFSPERRGDVRRQYLVHAVVNGEHRKLVAFSKVA